MWWCDQHIGQLPRGGGPGPGRRYRGPHRGLREMADISLCLPSTDTPRIQEAHILAGHIICQLVEEALFGGDHE
ncbi:MAG: hypothetical protein QGG56_08625 [Dehalococcoidia bacterium]|nr:hypothetical protein [Dehalococcoidia bacterium]